MNNELTEKNYWESAYRENQTLIPLEKNHPIINLVYKHFSNLKDHSLFEVGCFPGRILYHYGLIGLELNGIDYASDVKFLSKILSQQNFKVGNFINDDFNHYINTNRYDLVTSHGFIEHFQNYDEIIMKHFKLVKDNGLLFITTPNFSGLIQKFLHNFFDIQNLKRHNLDAMDPFKWKEIMIKNGFEIIDFGYAGGFDFWYDSNLPFFKRKIASLITKITPIRWLPNHSYYSPEIYIIARKQR